MTRNDNLKSRNNDNPQGANMTRNDNRTPEATILRRMRIAMAAVLATMFYVDAVFTAAALVVGLAICGFAAAITPFVIRRDLRRRLRRGTTAAARAAAASAATRAHEAAAAVEALPMVVTHDAHITAWMAAWDALADHEMAPELPGIVRAARGGLISLQTALVTLDTSAGDHWGRATSLGAKNPPRAGLATAMEQAAESDLLDSIIDADGRTGPGWAPSWEEVVLAVLAAKTPSAKADAWTTVERFLAAMGDIAAKGRAADDLAAMRADMFPVDGLTPAVLCDAQEAVLCDRAEPADADHRRDARAEGEALANTPGFSIFIPLALGVLALAAPSTAVAAPLLGWLPGTGSFAGVEAMGMVATGLAMGVMALALLGDMVPAGLSGWWQGRLSRRVAILSGVRYRQGQRTEALELEVIWRDVARCDADRCDLPMGDWTLRQRFAGLRDRVGATVRLRRAVRGMVRR